MGDFNGYTYVDAYKVLQELLARDGRYKQLGNGYLSGPEIAVIGECITRLRNYVELEQLLFGTPIPTHQPGRAGRITTGGGQK